MAGRSTQTRLEERPGEGTTVSGPPGRWNSVETPVVGALVREGAGDRALVIAPGARRDAGRGAAQRVAAVGADDEAGGDARAVGEPDVGLGGADLDAGHGVSMRVTVVVGCGAPA